MSTLKRAAAVAESDQNEGPDQNEDPPEARQPTTQLTPPDWPQPNGLFKDVGGKRGVVFNYHVLFSTLSNVYKAVESHADLSLEETAFLTLLARRSIQIEDGSILFKLLAIPCVPPPPQALIIDRVDNKYLKIDLVAGS